MLCRAGALALISLQTTLAWTVVLAEPNPDTCAEPPNECSHVAAGLLQTLRQSSVDSQGQLSATPEGTEDAGPPTTSTDSAAADADNSSGMRADDPALANASALPSNASGPPFLLNVTPVPTASGCTCSSSCGATMDDWFTCNWCWTKGRCGRGWSWGKWDYCVYPSPQGYDARDHVLKRRQLWKEITAEGSVGKSSHVKSPLEVAESVIFHSMREVFDTNWDVLPHDRGKGIHFQGAHCLFQLDVESGSPYDGLLRPGVRKGILRMSNAVAVEWGFVPGLALKFLRSGRRSGNVMALRSEGAPSSFNFFNSSFSNHVPTSESLALLGKFEDASLCTGMVGLSELCRHDEDGRGLTNFTFPYQLIFQPSGFPSFPEEEVNDTQLVDQLTSIPSGTHLFDVYAQEQSHSSAAYLGKLSTRSQCVRSLFGDRRLLFQHQRMEEDFALRPQWMQTARGRACGSPSTAAAHFKCQGAR